MPKCRGPCQALAPARSEHDMNLRRRREGIPYTVTYKYCSRVPKVRINLKNGIRIHGVVKAEKIRAKVALNSVLLSRGEVRVQTVTMQSRILRLTVSW